jgi:hypothetical protein
MKFLHTKLFRSGQTIEDVIKYLSLDLATGLRDIYTGLSHLNFADNFQSFRADISFTGAQEVTIRHDLGGVPTSRIIVRSTASDIVDGDTPWTSENAYMKKTGAGAATATVIFLR